MDIRQVNQIEYISHIESQAALKQGKRVRFNYGHKSVEINLDTTLEDLRWRLMAQTTLTAADVKENAYSIINVYRVETDPTNFYLVKNRVKTFEVLKDVEHLHVGDVLVYYEKEHGQLIGHSLEKEITYITNQAQQTHHFVLGID